MNGIGSRIQALHTELLYNACIFPSVRTLLGILFPFSSIILQNTISKIVPGFNVLFIKSNTLCGNFSFFRPKVQTQSKFISTVRYGLMLLRFIFFCTECPQEACYNPGIWIKSSWCGEIYELAKLLMLNSNKLTEGQGEGVGGGHLIRKTERYGSKNRITPSVLQQK